MNSSIELLITYIITFMYWRDLTKRDTRRTRNVLNILTDLKAEIAEPPPVPKINNSTRLRDTITESKIFMLSFKYSTIPIPIIFMPISIVKIYVNAKLH